MAVRNLLEEPAPMHSFRLLLLLVFSAAASACAPDVRPVDPGGPVPTPDPGYPVLSIVHVNVGQGDATLIKGPDAALLVDGGNEGMGSQRVLGALQAHGVVVLDWAVSTHPHADHIGGLDEVFERVDVLGGVFDNGESSATQAYDNYATAAALTAGGRRTIQIGQQFDLGEGAKATCIAVNGALLDGSQATASSTNDRSVALLVEWGDFRYVVAGDLGGYDDGGAKDVESQLAPLIGDVDVIQVNHHGSRFSTNATWLNVLKPEAAILSLGDGNNYGHPAAETLSRLTAADASVTIPPVDLYLTERGDAPTTYVGEGDVVVTAQPTTYTIGYQQYDASAF